MKRLILILSIFLASCSLFPTKPNAVITDKIVKLDPRVLIACEDLITVPMDIKSFDTILAVSVANTELYLDCRSKQNNSIILIKQFANIKDKAP